MKLRLVAVFLASTFLVACSSNGSKTESANASPSGTAGTPPSNSTSGSSSGSTSGSTPTLNVHQIRFAPGSSSTKVEGSIAGRETADYKANAKAGQTMNVELRASNSSIYFNVLPPGSESALFNGSTSGNKWTGDLPSNGDYIIRVYLMGSAADRNDKVTYALSVGIKGGEFGSVAGDAKVPGTPYHATGEIRCVMAEGQPDGSCKFGVIRQGYGSGSVIITKPDGRTRTIFFKNGKATGYDQSQADSGKFSATKQSDNFIIHIGAERYEIPDAVIFGG